GDTSRFYLYRRTCRSARVARPPGQISRYIEDASARSSSWMCVDERRPALAAYTAINLVFGQPSRCECKRKAACQAAFRYPLEIVPNPNRKAGFAEVGGTADALTTRADRRAREHDVFPVLVEQRPPRPV